MSNLISILPLSYFLGATIALLALQIIRNVFLSPLRHIPGPFLAKVTPYWLIFVGLAGHRTTTLHRLHERYGSTIRIGPHEVSYSNQDIIKELYSQQTVFLKAPVYDTMVVPPGGIFSFRKKKQHSQRRRLLSHAFSQANLLDTEPLIRDQVKNALSCINSSLGVPLDILTTFRRLSLDIVGELFLGMKFNGLNSVEPPEFLADMDLHFLLCGIQQNFPLLYHSLSILPIPSVRYFLGARRRLIKYGENAFYSYIGHYGRDSGRRDLLTKVLVAKNDEPPLTDLEIYTEISNLVFAGTDTTSTTLTYLFWTLAKHPEWQVRLRTELATISKSSWSDGIPTYKDVMELPLLEAAINEALRLYPAAPSSMMRETPPGGKVLNNVFVPEKTVVSMQCYTTHRNHSAFPNPEQFLPERWLNTSDDMKLNFMPFSAGSRACLGINLAWMELKVITAALVNNYTVQLAPNTTDESMSIIDHFLAAPKAGKCPLIFTKIN